MDFDPRWQVAAPVGLTLGLVMGLITVFGAPTTWLEALLWTLAYGVAAAYLVMFDVPGRFWTAFTGSIFAGLTVATFQSALVDTYRDQRTSLDAYTDAELIQAFYLTGLMFGLVYGLLLGAVVIRWHTILERRDATTWQQDLETSPLAEPTSPADDSEA